MFRFIRFLAGAYTRCPVYSWGPVLSGRKDLGSSIFSARCHKLLRSFAPMKCIGTQDDSRKGSGLRCAKRLGARELLLRVGRAVRSSSQFVMRLGEVWGDRHCLLERANRILVAMKVKIEFAHCFESPRVIRIDSGGLLKVVQSVRHVVLLHFQRAKVIGGGKIRGIEFQAVPERGRGALASPSCNCANPR